MKFFLGIPSLPKNVKIGSVLKGLTFQCIIKRSNLKYDSIDSLSFHDVSSLYSAQFRSMSSRIEVRFHCHSDHWQIIDMINVFFSRKLRHFGLCYSTCVCVLSEYLSLADSKLFKSTRSPSHCLSHILPPEKNLSGLRLEDMFTSFPYVSIVFVETLLFPDDYSIFM